MRFTKARILSILLFFILFLLIWVLGVEWYMFEQVNNYPKYWQKKALEEGEILYLALGDSSAVGIGASSARSGYVGMFAERIEGRLQKKVKVINLGVSGAKTEDVLNKQIPDGIKTKADIVTLSIGTNDLYTDLRLDEILNNFEMIFKRLPKGTYIAEVPYLMWGERDRKGLDINNRLKELANKYDQIMVPLYNPTKEIHFRWDTYAPDFFHPNDKGYEVWTDSFVEAFDKNQL